jgi:putative addiction module component (TIGR02574 family)
MEARATLIERLRDTLSPRLAKEIEESWLAEIDRRVDEIEKGTAKLVPGEEVFRSLHERYGR